MLRRSAIWMLMGTATIGWGLAYGNELPREPVPCVAQEIPDGEGGPLVTPYLIREDKIVSSFACFGVTENVLFHRIDRVALLLTSENQLIWSEGAFDLTRSVRYDHMTNTSGLLPYYTVDVSPQHVQAIFEAVEVAGLFSSVGIKPALAFGIPRSCVILQEGDRRIWLSNIAIGQNNEGIDPEFLAAWDLIYYQLIDLIPANREEWEIAPGVTETSFYWGPCWEVDEEEPEGDD